LKKLLLSLFIFIISITIYGCSSDITSIEYLEYTIDFEFMEGYYWDLETGQFEENSSFSSTSRELLQGVDITLSDYESVSYILFWNSNNYYLGYYCLQGLDNTLDTMLQDNINSNDITVPSGANKIALLIENGNTLINLIEDPSFESETLIDGGDIPNWDELDYATPMYDEYFSTVDEYNLMRVDCVEYGEPTYIYYELDSPLINGNVYWLYIDIAYLGITSGIGGSFKVYTGTGTSKYSYTLVSTISDNVYSSSQSWYDVIISNIYYNLGDTSQILYFMKDQATSNSTQDYYVNSVNFYDLSATFGDDIPSETAIQNIIDLGGTSGVEILDFFDITVTGEELNIINIGENLNTLINNRLSVNFNISTQGQKLLVFLVVVVISIVVLFLLKMTLPVIVIIMTIEFLIAYSLNWVDAWLVLIVSILILLLVGLKIIKGGKE